MNVTERMLSRAVIDQNEPYSVDGAPCWHWIWGKNSYGYGSIRFDGRSHHAHRVMWQLWYGPIPHGRQLDHLCRNRLCINPAHLELVTQRVNILRGESWSALNSRRTQCPAGHEYDEANTRIAPNGGRRCRACHRERERARRTKKGVKE